MILDAAYISCHPKIFSVPTINRMLWAFNDADLFRL